MVAVARCHEGSSGGALKSRLDVRPFPWSPDRLHTSAPSEVVTLSVPIDSPYMLY